MAALVGNLTIGPDALRQMHEGNRPGTQWAAFQNHAMDSVDLGGLRFLQVGGVALL